MTLLRSLWLRWHPAFTTTALAFTLGGCECSLQPADDDGERGCIIGTQCPDGHCVVPLFGQSEDICCGFGGECPPCSGGGALDSNQVECPDGTCVAWDADCCEHGGACPPTPDDGSGSSSEGSDSGNGSSDSTSGDTGVGTETDTDTDISTSADTAGETELGTDTETEAPTGTSGSSGDEPTGTTTDTDPSTG